MKKGDMLVREHLITVRYYILEKRAHNRTKIFNIYYNTMINVENLKLCPNISFYTDFVNLKRK